MKLPPPPDRMLKISASILGVLLCISVLIVWVPGAYINPTLFQAGLILTVSFWALRMVFRPYAIATSFPLVPITIAACWGLLQLAAHTTVSRWETGQAVVTWTGNLAAFFLALQVCQSTSIRRRLFDALLMFALFISVVSVLQFYTMPDKIMWYYYDGFGSSFGPFANHAHFAAFAELTMPLALLKALKQKGERKTRYYTAIAATIFSAVIAGASRAGTILIIAEVIIFLGAAAKQRSLARERLHISAVQFAIFASIITVVFGYSLVLQRLEDPDPYQARREMLQSSMIMGRERPWLGFGLGSYQNAYPKYSVMDMNKITVHAHNDWAEWLAEGGIPFLLIMLSIAIWAVPRGFQSLWGIGILIVFCHSWVDFSLQIPVLEFWVFTFLGALGTELGSTTRQQRESN